MTKGLQPLLVALLILFPFFEAKSQTIELLGGNMLNGAVTGSALGAAVMGLQNSGDFTPLRIGVGVGTLAGTGIGIYDFATLPRGEVFFISGTFNDGNNTSIIILLDTFYGAAGGAILASAVVLLAEKSFVDGLRYGTSIGTWVGFGFGLVDAFLIGQRTGDFTASKWLDRESMISIYSNSERYRLGLIQPSAFILPERSHNDLKTTIRPVLEIVSLRVGL